MTMTAGSPDHPTLQAGDERLGRLYGSALATLARVVKPGPQGAPPVVTAGGGYPTPWTRDASINAWSGVSLLDPPLAAATLRAVTQPGPEGDVVQQDNQLWDQVVWVVAAWRHVQVTGDLDWARWALGVARRTLALRENAFRTQMGLFAGAALMQDGISGYPFPVQDRAGDSSFVGDYRQADEIACLSTNLLYAAAFDAVDALGRLLESPSIAPGRGGQIRSALRRILRDPATGRWSYLVHPDGQIEAAQELLGQALLLEVGDLDTVEAASLAAGIQRSPAGISLVYPHFQRYRTDRPGRHNVMLWPMAIGQWAVAAAHRGLVDAFGQSLDDLVRLVSESQDAFFEVYDAENGSVSGGWQVGETWPSEPDQTWSATAFLRCVHEGLLGLRSSTDGLAFAPVLPAGTGPVAVHGLPWRDSLLDIEVCGGGNHLAGATFDNEKLLLKNGFAYIAPTTGRHHIRLDLME
jgi:hypothetical protein